MSDCRTVWLCLALSALLAAGSGCRRETQTPDVPEEPASVGNWPRFRGPAEDGSAPDGGDPPVTIDLERDVRFRVDVPAKGQSSPIVWGERIFLTGEGERVLAFDRTSGKLLWNTALDPGERVAMPGDEDFEGHDDDTGPAAPTPCTDGQRVYAFFGSGVLGCVDFDGKEVWSQRLFPGKPRNSFGLAASPVLYGDLVIQVVDMGAEPEDGLSFIVAVRAADGVEVWRADRPTRSAWPTPLLLSRPEGDQLITSAFPYVIAYDPKSGVELWRVEGIGGDVAGSPVAAGKLVLAPGGEGDAVWAIRPDGKGDVTGTHVQWKVRIPMPDVASPVSTADRYVQVSSGADVICLDAADGKEVWRAELRGMFWASPVRVGERIYLVEYDGKVVVLALKDGAVLGESKLGAKVTASPAIIDGRIYLRTADQLMCLGR